MSLTPQERSELVEAVTLAMSASIGPAGDMQRAVMSAKVDGLIDARKRFIAAGWPEWLIQTVLVAFITGHGPMLPKLAMADDDDDE